MENICITSKASNCHSLLGGSITFREEVEPDTYCCRVQRLLREGQAAMRAKRERLPLIEAFILTGLLVEFVSHPSLSSDRVAPMPLVQALGHESVATQEPLLVRQTKRQHQYLSALVKGDRFQQNPYPLLLSGVSDYFWQCAQAQSLTLKHSRYYSSY